MKNIARLALFFSISFTVLFLAGTGFRFMALRVQWLRYLPRQPETVLTLLIAAAHWALSFALYGSLLMGLSYAARRQVFAPAALLCVAVLSTGFSFGISLALERWELVPPAQSIAPPLGGAGIILNQTQTSVVLLQGAADPRSPRVTAIPGRPLLYQAEPSGPNNTVLALPPLPLGTENQWFLQSIGIDLRLNAEQTARRIKEGLADFFIYTGALIFLLCSLGFIFKVSAWPMANIFLGFFAFRGILAMETFLNSPDTQNIFESFLGNRLSPSLIVPLIFCGFALLVYIYSILVYLTKRRIHEED